MYGIVFTVKSGIIYFGKETIPTLSGVLFSTNFKATRIVDV